MKHIIAQIGLIALLGFTAAYGQQSPSATPAVSGQPVAATGQTGQKYTLKSARTANTIDKIAYQLDIRGNLIIPDEKDSSKQNKLPVTAVTKQAYNEKNIEFSVKDEAISAKSVRNYQQSVMERTIDGEKDSMTLSPKKNILQVFVNPAGLFFYSKDYAMVREDLNNLEAMVPSLTLDSLLPDKPVAINDEWGITEHSLKLLLQMDSISQAQVAQILSDVKSNTGIIDAQGWVEGLSEGVRTVISFKLKYYFSLRSQRIVWAGMLTNEKRESGPISPQLEMESRIQMTIQPNVQDPQLAQTEWLAPTEEKMLLMYAGPGNQWSLYHDRRWHVVQETDANVSMRFLAGDQYVAQCFISKTHNPETTFNMTLAGFQAEVLRTIAAEKAESKRKIVSAAEEASPAGLKAYQIVVASEQEKARWVYYMMTGKKAGDQLVFVFMVEEPNLELVGDTDMAMIGTLKFN